MLILPKKRLALPQTKHQHDMRQLLIIAFLLISSTTFATNAGQPADSLLRLLKTTQSSEDRIRIYRDLADIHTSTPEYKDYLLKMYSEAQKSNNRLQMLNALNDLVIEKSKSYEKDTIVKYINCVKQIATPEELKRILPFFRMRFFETLCYLNKSEEAINEELQFLDSKDIDNNDIYRKISLDYITGVSFYTSGQYERAVPYLEKAVKLCETLPESSRFQYLDYATWRLCYSLAQSGKRKEPVPLMEDLIKKLEINYKQNYQKQRPFYPIDMYYLQYYSFMLASLPFLTIQQEQCYWERVQQVNEKLTNPRDKYNYYLCANNYYTHNRTKKDYSKAIAANDSMIEIAKDLAPKNLPGLYEVNSALYEDLKDYPSSLKYLKLSYQVRDSIDTEAMHKQLNELQVKYDLNVLNNEKNQLEIKNKRILVISLSVLLAIVISVCSYLYFSLKKEKEMKAALKRLHSKAQESEKMKQSFINSICHEIRTPLNAIVGFSDLIMNEDIDEEMRREFPAEIQKSTRQLTGLVNSMLEVANLDVSEEKLPCEPTDIRNICIQEMERISPKLGIKYELDITEDTLLIPTNAQYLTMVIEHLLNNANKFTEKGFIKLGYKVNHSNDKICISVTDSGCGIPKEKREEVFNRFSKLDSFVPGNGLGLYLCRLIVKRLDGEIRIDPDYTEGTKIIVTLPIE